ncbi:MAG: hypothetical protein JXA77_17670 [Bacteroidales bacterium]|nr:hypothetical protein [Bacteroidales bacterium]MBN2821129.1 hypothetical protein [Bacteroidales bacterium]
MKKYLMALLMGAAAGITDVIPMFIMQLNWYANLSAFVHWVVLGLIIPFVSWNMKSWLKGVIIAVISAIPVIILTLEDGSESIGPILLSSVILGALIGLLSNKYIKQLNSVF